MSNILTGMLESLKLETISQVYSSIAIDAEKHSKTYTDYLKDLASIEIEERRNKTIAKFLKQAKLPRDKLSLACNITRTSVPGTTYYQHAHFCFSPKM